MKKHKIVYLLSAGFLLASCGGSPTVSSSSMDEKDLESSLNSEEEAIDSPSSSEEKQEDLSLSSSSIEEKESDSRLEEESSGEESDDESESESEGEDESSSEESDSLIEEESSSEEEGLSDSSESSVEEAILYSIFLTRLNRANVTILNEGSSFSPGDNISFTASASIEGYLVKDFYFVGPDFARNNIYEKDGVYSFEMPSFDVYLQNGVTKMTRIFANVDAHCQFTLLNDLSLNAYFLPTSTKIYFTLEVDEGYSLYSATYSGSDFETDSEVNGEIMEENGQYYVPAIAGDISIVVSTLADTIDDGTDPWSKKGSDTTYVGHYDYYNTGDHITYDMVLTLVIHPNLTLDVNLDGFWSDNDEWGYDDYWALPPTRTLVKRGSANYINNKKNIAFAYSKDKISFTCPYKMTSSTLNLAISKTLYDGVPETLTCLNDISTDQYYTSAGCVLSQQ